MNNSRYREVEVRISEQAMVRLWEYDWPGNVRQLENLVERLVILSETGVIQPSDLPLRLRTLISPWDIPEPVLGEGVDLFAVVEAFENDLIDKAMGRTGGNRQAAATLLGSNRTTLVAKLDRRSKLAKRAIEASGRFAPERAESDAGRGTGYESGIG